jgi:hypothetical protein
MLRNLIFFSLILLCKCAFNNSKDETKETIYPSAFVCKNEFDIKLIGKIDPYFGTHTFLLDTICNMLYLNDSSSLVILDPKSNTSVLIDFSPYVKGLNIYSASVSGNNMLYFFNQDSAILYEFQISSQKELIERKKIHLSKRLKTYNPELFEKEKGNSPFIYFQHTNTFRIDSSYMYIAYGIYDRKYEFLDKYAYLKISLDDTTLQYQKYLRRPEIFRSGKYDIKTTVLNFFPDGGGIYSFQSYDSIYSFDRNGQITNSRILNSNKNFKFFNQKKRRDLGYMRIHTATNEANTLMITGEKNEVFIIKKLAKEKLSDKSKSDIYILDSALNIKYKGNLPDYIQPYDGIRFENGILLFKTDMTKAYYYEVY